MIKEYPPIVVMGSNGLPTKSKIMRNGPKSFNGWDLETPESVPGDGRYVS